MIRRLLTTLLLAALIFTGGVSASPQQDFIDRIGPIAAPIVREYGLFPSVFLAQVALESGWGTSYLATEANNLFGRKCGRAPCVEINTVEYRGGVRVIEVHAFQVYESLEASVHDYCQKFFRPLYTPDLSGPEAFVRSIAARYATDPRYAAKVIQLMREYELERWNEL